MKYIKMLESGDELKLTGFPIVMLDGEEIEIARKLKGYEWAFSMLPLLLIFIGGAIGGAFGALGFSVNVMLFRSKLPIAVKIILSILVLLAVVVTHFVIAGLIYYSMLITARLDKLKAGSSLADID